jgi:hypothetical protein
MVLPALPDAGSHTLYGTKQFIPKFKEIKGFALQIPTS